MPIFRVFAGILRQHRIIALRRMRRRFFVRSIKKRRQYRTGVPTEIQRSDFGGERTSSGTNELSSLRVTE